jgi:signal transduction histidine kinase/CHASE3 domain sensor protein
VAALVALVVIAIMSLQSARQLSVSSAQVTHTLDVLMSAERLLSLLKDAETGQRGYLLVRDASYLVPYQTATQAIEPALQHLRTLTSDNPGQQVRLDRIETLIREKLEELAGTLALDARGDPAAALELVRTNQGKQLMDSLRGLLHEVQREEQRLLAERNGRLSQVTQRATVLVLGGIGLLGALTLLAASMASRDFLALNRAAWEHQKYEERLVTLHAIDRAILRAASSDEIIRAALTALRQGVGCERVDLLRFEPGQEEARALICDEAADCRVEERIRLAPPPSAEELDGSSVRDLASLPEPLRSAPPYVQLLQSGLRHEVRLPLHSQGQLVGSLGLISRRPETLDGRAVQVAREVAAQVSIALEQARLRERLQGEAARLEQQVQARTAELKEANAELEAFSYSVSHDLRAPLRAIDGFSQAVEDDTGNVLTDRSRRFFHKVKTASGRMGELIDALLSLSRLSRAELLRERVNLTELAAEAIADLRAREPGRQVEVSLQEGLWVVGDRRLLRVVLDNLLGNAWKFSGQQPHPRIELSCVEQQGESVFSVRDNGAGFDMTYAEKLFSPFQRLHGDEEFPGTGIGLATVHRILRRHGGRIWADSAEGAGARFFFTLGGEHGQ